MKNVMNFFGKNFAVVWLIGAILYYLLGVKDIAFNLMVLFVIEDLCDRIEWYMSKKSIDKKSGF
jgi:hypothetical protein